MTGIPLDTLRVLVSWACNRHCPYCCNEQPQFRRQFRLARLDDLDFGLYQTICISGGEPLLFPDRVAAVCRRVPKGKLIVLYTNGDMLTPLNAKRLAAWGVQSLNIGLHDASEFDIAIPAILAYTFETGLVVRFHAQEMYEHSLTRLYPEVRFKFWTMNDCDRSNEDRVVLVSGRYGDGED